MYNIHYISYLARFILTPIIALAGNNYLKLVIILIFLDLIDCNPLFIKLLPKEEIKKQEYCSKNRRYFIVDKWLDLYQYIFALILLRSIFSNNSYYILISLFFYRFIGVILYQLTGDSINFIYFFDFIKEYIVLIAIYGNKVPRNILVTSVVLKIGYEYLIYRS